MNKKENLVDMLLTYEWPSNITNNSQQAITLNINNTRGQNEIATLNMELSPRYHFAASENIFFEREPFKNQAEHHTRFIGLGSFGNSKKERVKIKYFLNIYIYIYLIDKTNKKNYVILII